MTATPVYSNHAGTLSSSFLIGKSGVQLLQGTSSPTGLSAPIGSLYIQKGLATNQLYQLVGSAPGTWQPLLSPNSIQAGSGVEVVFSNGVVNLSTVSGKYQELFTNASLVSQTLTVMHDLDEEYPIVQIYNDGKQVILPDLITAIDANNLVVDLSSYTVNNTWAITVLSGNY